MQPLRLKVKVDPDNIAFCRVWVVDKDEGISADIAGVMGIDWRIGQEGLGTVVLTVDASMVDFNVVNSRAEKE